VTVAELIVEVERAPRGARVRALVVGRDHVTVAVNVERVLKEDVVIVAASSVTR
jgi:hypothetical protein